jgi:hypothetical protein
MAKSGRRLSWKKEIKIEGMGRNGVKKGIPFLVELVNKNWFLGEREKGKGNESQNERNIGTFKAFILEWMKWKWANKMCIFSSIIWNHLNRAIQHLIRLFFGHSSTRKQPIRKGDMPFESLKSG